MKPVAAFSTASAESTESIGAATRAPLSRGVWPWAVSALLAVGIAPFLGATSLDLSSVLQDASSIDRTLFLELRLPRVLLAAFTGATLALVGGSYQSLLANPLADPYLLGVSGGAALGASLAIVVLPMGMLAFLSVPMAAFLGGLASTVLVLRIANRSASSHSMVLTGVALNAVASALVTVIKSLAPPTEVSRMLNWLVGFVDTPTPAQLAVVGTSTTLGIIAIQRRAPAYNVLSLGPEWAQSVGLDLKRLAREQLLIASILIGVVVSLTGMVGFVGLLVPHFVRRWVGPDNRIAFPAIACAGATLLVSCDTLARLAFPLLQTELPVGVLTATVGGPALMWALQRRSKET